MNKILSIGETIIDFISLNNGKNLCNAEKFAKKAGGSSANVANGLAKLDVPVSFCGIIGDDEFGKFLEKNLTEQKVNCTLLKKTKKACTPFVFVTLDSNGNNEFYFYRDFKLNEEFKITKKDLNFVKKHSIFHFSSVILKEKNFQAQIKKILNSKKDKIINFDVNIRYSLWKNHNELKKIVIEYIKLSDIIKFSEKELEFITGSNHSDIKKTLEKTLFLKNKLIIVTLGERGCCAFYNGQFISCNPKFKSKIIDTTGAGDAFVSAFLFQLLKNNIVETKKLQELFSNNIIEKILLFSNAAGTLSATKRGATTGLATEKKIINFMKKL